MGECDCCGSEKVKVKECPDCGDSFCHECNGDIDGLCFQCSLTHEKPEF